MKISRAKVVFQARLDKKEEKNNEKSKKDNEKKRNIILLRRNLLQEFVDEFDELIIKRI